MNVLLEYLSFACTGTGQATFYNTKEESVAALSQLHTAALAENRRIYALSAMLPVNDRSKQLVLLNLLIAGRQRAANSPVQKAGDNCRQDPELEWQLIQSVAQTLPFNRLLNLFLELQQYGVNNARTRRLGKWLWNRYGDAFRAIKYRNKFRVVLRHCHIPEGSASPAKAELHRWVFGKLHLAQEVQHNPLLASRLAAVRDYEAVFALPFDIARDIAVCQHNRKPDEFTREFAERGKLTRKEQLRAQSAAGVEVDYRKFSLLELLRHLYQHPLEWELIAPVLDVKAWQLASLISLPPKVALVVDNSHSAMGAKERLYYPLAVMEAIARICLAVKNSDVSHFYVGEPLDRRSWLKAGGNTQLRLPLAQALASRPDAVLILSDGYENTSAGSVAQMLNTKAVRESGIAIIHLNPVAAAEAGGVRRLADVPTFGVSLPEQLPLFALLGQAYSQPGILETFCDRIENALKGGDFHAARLIAGFHNHIAADGGEHDDGAVGAE